MAKIVQDNIVIAVSKIARDSESDDTKLVNSDTLAELETLVTAMLGDGFVVEILS